MKTISQSECISQSDQSNILSLSSNRSESIKKQEPNKLEKIKSRLFRVFGVQSVDVNEIFHAIQNEFSQNYLHQTVGELNEMLESLGRVKKNNREMAKLMSSLGVKLDEISNNKLKIKSINPKCLSQPSKQAETNQTSISYDQYNFEYHPAKPLFHPQSVQENTQLNGSNSYAINEMNHKMYKGKIIQMLHDLGNIKNELNSAKLPSTKQRKNKIQKPRHQLQNHQVKNQIKELEHHKSSQATKSELEGQKSLLENGLNQKSLYIKANQIAKRLEEIKSKIQGIKTENKNEQKLLSNDPQSNPLKSRQQRSFSLNKKKKFCKQKSVRFESNSNSSFESKQLSMATLEENKLSVLQKPVQKKSFLDEMKNVESKMIISDKQINGQETLIDVFNGLIFADKIKNVSPSSVQKNNINENYEESLKQKSSIKQVVISYSSMHGSNVKNHSFHNTSIMNPHYIPNREKPVQNITDKKEYVFSNNSVRDFNPINRRNNEYNERSDKRSYSKEYNNIGQSSQYRMPFIIETKSIHNIDHSKSSVNIGLQNSTNRLIHPFKHQTFQPIHSAKSTHSLIPLNRQKFNHLHIQNSQRFQPKLVNPFENISQELEQKKIFSQINPPLLHRNISYSNQNTQIFRSSSKKTQSNQKTNHQTSGINLSVIKGNPSSSFIVTLGKQTEKMRDSSYSRDSKKGRGVKLSNQFF